ncbi:MAG: NADP(H)-dependent aldo-keto reductase [Chromatiales bacterium]|nr:NADP(H)-dependent aldo-keto reductase [Chromatiales bacterium]
MEYTTLGRTGIRVSRICLGTMTFGEQNTETAAHAQLDLALERGVNFIDAAEMYPVPPKPQTQGRTEQYIGSWLAQRGRRDDVVLATKVSGPAAWMEYLRPGTVRLDRRNLEAALAASLRRLGTDYVDLYQVHWPDRRTNYFGELGYRHQPDHHATVPIEETLVVLDAFVRAGKVRAVGISNETPWGAMRYLDIAGRTGQARVASIQNPYSLLNRSFEVGLAEIAMRESLGLLAYSPLAFGVLSGKYLNGGRPAGARLTLFTRFDRYNNAQCERATHAYVDLARTHGLDPAQMALAFVNQQPFVTANIIGATTIGQLEYNIASIDLKLGDAVRAGIEAIHTAQPNPGP